MVTPHHQKLSNSCYDCAAKIGETHEDGCGHARCLGSGRQLISCGMGRAHAGECLPDKWMGLSAAAFPAIERGWYAKLVPGHGWVRTTANDPDGRPDLNRVMTDCRWDPQTRTWVDR